MKREVFLGVCVLILLVLRRFSCSSFGYRVTPTSGDPKGGGGVVVDDTGNFIVIGSVDYYSTRSMIIGKFNSTGEPVWAKTIEQPGRNFYGRDIRILRSTGDVVILGSQDSTSYFYLLLFNSEGSFKSIKSSPVESGNRYIEATHMIELTGGDELLINGVVDTALYGKTGFLYKVDATLSVIWRYFYYKPIYEIDIGGASLEMKSLGDDILYGISTKKFGTPTYKIAISRMDPLGTTVKFTTLIGRSVGNDFVNSICRFDEDEYLYVGFSSGYNNTQTMILGMIDGDGIVQWHKVIFYSDYELSGVSCACSEIAIKQCFFGGHTDYGDLVIGSIKSDGTIQFLRTYGFDFGIFLYSLQSYGSSLVITGSNENDEMFVSMLDSFSSYMPSSTFLYITDLLELPDSEFSVYDGDYTSNTFTASEDKYKRTTFGISYSGSAGTVFHDVLSSTKFITLPGLTKCYGSFGAEPDVCNYVGYCKMVNPSRYIPTRENETYCYCDDEYFGDTCNITTCENIWNNGSDPNICRSHGSCVFLDVCLCDGVYRGFDCELATCFNDFYSDINPEKVCSGHGDCFPENVCSCFNYSTSPEDQKYFGVDCNTTKCRGIFSNVTSSSNIIYYGEHNSTAAQYPCFSRGSCIDWDICSCTSHFDSSTYCKTCLPKYYGLKCDITKCDGFFSNDTTNVCSGNGECILPGVCRCDPEKHFEGNRCSECQDSWFGRDCEVTTCYDILSNDSRVCSNKRGNCTDPGACFCQPGKYLGSQCEQSMCFGIGSTETASVCSNHGDCVEFDACRCSANFFGKDCKENIKFVSFTDNLRTKIRMQYFLYKQEFITSLKTEIMKGIPFNCSQHLDLQLFDPNSETWEYFLEFFNSSYCQFVFLEIVQGVEFSESLIIQIMSKDEYDRVFSSQESSDLALQTYFQDKIVANMSIQLSTITVPSQGVDLYVQGFDASGSGDSTANSVVSSSSSVADILWMLITFPTLFLFCCLLGFVSIYCICCICVCFLICFVCSGGFCSSQLLASYSKKLSRFEELDNFDLLLTEQRLESQTDGPKIKIKNELFEVDAKKIKLISLVGEGGSEAVVYKADWNGKIIAFKCFKSRNICGDQSVFDEFEREANLLASIAHPNIIRFYGCALKEPRIGFIMEYCENGDLAKYIQLNRTIGEKILLSEKIRMLVEISSAMNYLHIRRIIHRDLKCENVLLDDSLSVRVMDFGISRMFEQTKQQKTKGIGTSIYISPEIVMMNEYNEKVDVFSFGILSWILWFEDLFPYGSEVQFVESKVANNPYYRPSFDRKYRSTQPSDNDGDGQQEPFEDQQEYVECPEFLKNMIISCWDGDPVKRKSFLEIIKYLEVHKALSIEQKDGKIVEDEGDDDFKKSIFLYIKKTGELEAHAERFFLTERTFQSLVDMIEEKFINNSSYKGHQKIKRITLLSSISESIETDQDVREKLTPNCLLDLEFSDDRDVEINRLIQENETLKKELEGVKTKLTVAFQSQKSRRRSTIRKSRRRMSKLVVNQEKKDATFDDF